MLSIGRAVVITLWKEGEGSQCPQDPHKAPLPEDMWYVIRQGQSLWRSMPRELISNVSYLCCHGGSTVMQFPVSQRCQRYEFSPLYVLSSPMCFREQPH